MSLATIHGAESKYPASEDLAGSNRMAFHQQPPRKGKNVHQRKFASTHQKKATHMHRNKNTPTPTRAGM
jgi:hypothetical protein